MPSSRRPGNRSGPRRTLTRIRNRLWWSIRPYAAGRRAPARNRGPERSCRTRRTSPARPAVAAPRAGRPAPPITGAARARRGTPRGRRAARPSAAPASGRGTTSSPREAIPRDACPTRRPAARRGLRRRRGVRRCPVRLCGGRPALWGVPVRRQRGGGSVRGGRRAPGSPCGARGRHVWRRHAAPRSPAGRGTGRAGFRGAGVPVSSSSRGPSCVTRAPRPPVGLPLRDHPSAGHRRVRVRHAAILRHREGSSYIAMVASIRWIVTSIWRVASRLGESVPSVAEGVRPPRRAGRAGRDTLRLPSVWRAWCAWRLGWASLSRRGSACRAATVPCGTRPPHAPARPSPRAERRAGGRWPPVCRWGGEWSPAPRRRRGGRRAPAPLEQPLNSRLTAAPIMPYNSSYSA